MALAPRCRGFTYIGLIVLLAILGLVGAAGMKTGSLMQRAAAEEELLEIGAAFSQALLSYSAATPKGQPPQPPTLEALLRDPRFPQVRRHLRKIFVDPMTGKAEWGIMTIGDKAGIAGVYSLSAAKPLKVGNFDARFVNFENKARLSDWKFTAAGQGMLILRGEGGPPQAAAPAAPGLPVVATEPPQAADPPPPVTEAPPPMPELPVEPEPGEPAPEPEPPGPPPEETETAEDDDAPPKPELPKPVAK